jgi:outer membrane protein OmpA-like peptidoglycan-associated protein
LRETGFGGEYWASATILALALLSLGIVAFGLQRGEPDPLAAEPAAPSEAEPPDAKELPLLQQWFLFLDELCTDPALIASGFQADCRRGTFALSEESFFEPGSTALLDPGKDRLRDGVTALLARLRDQPQIWDSLEAIEIRGHSDSQANRDPYRTNLVSSQRRAFSVAHFLSASGTLSERDRRALESLAVVSGVAHSRPPESCPDEARACRDQWRRVELRLVFDETRLRE